MGNNCNQCAQVCIAQFPYIQQKNNIQTVVDTSTVLKYTNNSQLPQQLSNKILLQQNVQPMTDHLQSGRTKNILENIQQKENVSLNNNKMCQQEKGTSKEFNTQKKLMQTTNAQTIEPIISQKNIPEIQNQHKKTLFNNSIMLKMENQSLILEQNKQNIKNNQSGAFKLKKQYINYQDQIQKQKKFNQFSLKMLYLYFDYGIQQQNNNNYKKALFLFKEAQSLCKTLQILYSTQRLIILNNIGLIYYKYNALDKAQHIYQKALKIYYYNKKQNYFVSSLLNNIGLLYCSKKDYKKAMNCINAAFDIDKKIYGDKHISLASKLTNLAAVLQCSQKYQQAQVLLQQALKIKTDVFGEYHEQIAISLHNLFQVHFKQGRLQKCIDNYQKIFIIILSLINNKDGSHIINISKYMTGIGVLLNGLIHLQDSKEKIICLKKAIRLIQNIFQDGKLKINIKQIKQMLLNKLQSLTK